jgi:hypothetical protein
MTRFSTSTKQSTKTTNHEGAEAYKLSPELELYSAVATSVLHKNFYEGAKARLTRIRKLIATVDPEFTMKLAVYAREEMHLRSIPLVLMVELSLIGKAKAQAVERVIQRADELYEILGYYELAGGRKGTKKLNYLSKQLQKGVASAFNKFDEYQFAKYNRSTVPSLRDALFLSHAKAKDNAQGDVFEAIADQKLQTPYTWETQLSEKGNTKEVWTELINSKKVGYMAMLRNMRNILNADVDINEIGNVARYIAHPDSVRRSKQLPFRFLSAYRELKDTPGFDTPMFLDALEQAIKISAENVPIDTDRIVIACDVSGSMQRPISPRSKVQYFDIGLVLGMMMNLICPRTIVGMFGETWKTIAVPKDNILRNADEFHQREGEVGYATDGWKVIDWMIRHGVQADKVMMFTDCQMWDSSGATLYMPWRTSNVHHHVNTVREMWGKYKQIVPHAKLYLFDTSGYGNTPISTNQQDVYFIAGWSDKIFGVLNALDEGSDAVKEINKIEI